jgi:phosphoglycerate dehydrogenase-like enzyme
MNTILIALDPDGLPADTLARIEEIAPDRRVVVTREHDDIEALLDQIEIAVGWFPRDLLRRATALRWFQQWSAGADWLLEHPEVSEQEFVLTSTSGIHAIQISEHIFAMLLAFARRLPDALQAQRRGAWEHIPGETLFELAGKTMLMVGVGAIGERTARVAQGLGMRVWGVRRDPSREVPHVERMEASDQIDGLLPEVDVVVLTVPLTDETRHMIGEAQLRRMKPTSYLVNIGRGGTVDDAALRRARKRAGSRARGWTSSRRSPYRRTRRCGSCPT